MSEVPRSILIVEDEPLIARRIARLCSEILSVTAPYIELVDTVQAGIERLERGGIDLLLLDLNLHGQDGFSILEAVAAFAAQTIIISANTDQALRAFDYGVLDFIGKPFQPERLKLGLDRYAQSAPQPRRSARFLSFRSGRRTRVVELDDVVLLRGADKYSEVVLTSGEVLLHDRSLGKLEPILPNTFMRVHKSRIVSLDRVRSVETADGNSSVLILDSGERAPVSRSKIAQVRALFQQSRDN